MSLSDHNRRHPKKIGLALGSGSARGWAHIGVIQALSEAGIRVDCVAGTSIGAMVGAVYASGKIDELEKIVLQFDWKHILHFFDIVFPKSGLIDGMKVADFIRSHVEEKNIEELPIPFRAVTTDLTTGHEVVIQDGDVIEAVRASISFPGIFTPVRKNGKILVDGGMVNPVPVSVVREMGADFVIAVDLSHDMVTKRATRFAPIAGAIPVVPGAEAGRNSTVRTRISALLNKELGMLDVPAFKQIRQWMGQDPLPSIFEVLINSIYIMENRIAVTGLQVYPPDLLIRPKLGHIRLLEFHRANEAIAGGYREAKAQIRPLTGKGGNFDHP